MALPDTLLSRLDSDYVFFSPCLLAFAATVLAITAQFECGVLGDAVVRWNLQLPGVPRSRSTSFNECLAWSGRDGNSALDACWRRSCFPPPCWWRVSPTMFWRGWGHVWGSTMSKLPRALFFRVVADCFWLERQVHPSVVLWMFRVPGMISGDSGRLVHGRKSTWSSHLVVFSKSNNLASFSSASGILHPQIWQQHHISTKDFEFLNFLHHVGEFVHGIASWNIPRLIAVSKLGFSVLPNHFAVDQR